MHSNLHRSSLFFALIGLVCIILAFGLYRSLDFHLPLRVSQPEEKLRQSVLAYLHQQGIEFEESPSFNREERLNKKVHRFLQVYYPGQVLQLSPELLRITYSHLNIGEIVINQKVKGVEVTLNGNGELRGFELHDLGKEDSLQISEPQAREIAEAFLTHQGLVIENLEPLSTNQSNEDGVQTYSFEYRTTVPLSDSLETRYSIAIAAAGVSQYRAELQVNDKKFSFSQSEERINTTLEVGAALMWAILAVGLLIIFLRRLRHDELEFRSALWVGIGSGVTIAVVVAVKAYPEWIGMLLGGLFSGLLGGFGLFLAYASVESMLRDIWPEKLREIDLLRLGRFRVQEIGIELLNSLGSCGIILLVFTLLLWITETAALGYFEISNDNLWRMGNWWSLAELIPPSFLSGLWAVLNILMFPALFLATRIKKGWLAIVLLSLCIEFAGLHSFYIQPNYLSFFLTLPVAVLLAVMVNRSNMLSSFLTLMLLFTANELYSGVGSPESLLQQMGVFLGGCAVILIAGIIAGNSEAVATDFENYVPEYVSRIAERERIKKELEIARSIQFKFLPEKAPDYPELEIASLCKPAMEVGGDYYDFIPEDDHLRVLVGDVSGKGVSAAFYMTMTKGIIKTLSRQVKDPATILTETNQIFYENSPRNVFISLLYGDFDLKGRELTFARAGHNPLLVHHTQDQRSTLLRPGGIAIGMDSGEVFRNTIHQDKVPFHPGDIFVFYTDGVSEAMNAAGEEFGEERLEQLIEDNAHLSAQQLLDHVHKIINDFCGNTPQHDDFTMVVIKIK